MTNTRTALHVQMVGDIPERLHLVLMKLPPGTDAIPTPPEQPAVGVCLPLRVNLLLQPDNKLLSSAELKQTLLFTLQEVHTIETYTKHHHLSKEDTLKELIKVSLQDHEVLRELTRQARRKPSKETYIEVEVQLWGPMSWDEKHTDNTTA